MLSHLVCPRCRKTNDFFRPALPLAISVNMLTRWKSSLVLLWSCVRLCHPKWRYCDCSFPLQVPPVSFSCLLLWPTKYPVSNRRQSSPLSHPWFPFQCSTGSRLVIHSFYYGRGMVLLFLFSSRLLSWRESELCGKPSASFEIIMWFFFHPLTRQLQYFLLSSGFSSS